MNFSRKGVGGGCWIYSLGTRELNQMFVKQVAEKYSKWLCCCFVEIGMGRVNIRVILFSLHSFIYRKVSIPCPHHGGIAGGVEL
jgi:hypothetical protein